MLDRIARWTCEAMDAGVRWQLGRLPVELPPAGSFDPADPSAFWAASALRDPAAVHAGPARVRRGGVEVRVLSGPSRGPGEGWGSRHLVATARLRPGRPDLPFVLAVHGLLAGSPRYEEWQCRRLTGLGAHAARIDLPFHLRRTPPGGRSGTGYITSDLRRTREVVRQSVEDCAAVLAWARREVSPRVAVLGTSLGGLVACLLAAHLELDAVVATAPFCDPAESLLDHLPARSRGALGLVGDGGGSWGPDRAAARLAVRAALAPIAPRAFSPPATPGERIAIVRPLLDGIVGEAPMRSLAEAWGAQVWSYRHGHISVMHARGVGNRLRRWVISEHAAVAQTRMPATLRQATGAIAP
jgi:dienelactone hydrolase